MYVCVPVTYTFRLYAPWLEHLKIHGFSGLFLDLDPDLPTRDPANVLQVMEKGT